MLSGIWHLPWWGYVVYTLVMTHITIIAVTVFLHRCQAHRALTLHPIVSHFFRLWLWLTTGMVTKAWAAIHRKHHARCETPEDPHSPQILGLKKLVLEGAELYKLEAKNKTTLEKFGTGTPDDWLERHVYSKHSVLGIGIMLVIDLILFGPIGATIWAVQMVWIPFWAAGIINGVGHYWGYRNFEAEDASRNIFPWGILIGGEELHNNHHAYGTSAKLSSKWWEFDIGWLYIRIMETLGLAQVKKVAPKMALTTATSCNNETLEAIIVHRYEVLTNYAKALKKTCVAEIQALRERAVPVDDKAIQWLRSDAQWLDAKAIEQIDAAQKQSKVLHTVYTMRQELMTIWQRSSASREQLVRQLEDWCKRAEASGIAALKEFSQRLRRYRMTHHAS